MLQKMSHQGKEDAQDYEGSERGGGHQAERTNGRRRPNGVGNTNDLRSGQSPHRFGLKRSNPRGSVRGQFSQALRSGQHHAQELPSVYPRVDHERTKPKLATRLLTRQERQSALSQHEVNCIVPVDCQERQERRDHGDSETIGPDRKIAHRNAELCVTPICECAATEHSGPGRRSGPRPCRQKWRWTRI